MRCCDARAWMSAYLDSELDAGTTFKVSCHLECCEACCERFASESSADASIAGELRRVAMPDALWSDLCCSVTGPRRRVHGGWLVFAATILAAGALVIVTDERTASAPDRSAEDPAETARAAQAAEGVRRDFIRTARADGTWVTDDGAPWVEVDGAGVGLIPLLDGSSLDLTAVEVGHATRLISIRRTQVEGREVMDVRLECCGEPVLLRVARAPGDDREVESDSGMARPSVERAVTADPKIADAGAAQVAARRVGEWSVIGASRHPIDHVLLALRLT